MDKISSWLSKLPVCTEGVHKKTKNRGTEVKYNEALQLAANGKF